MGRILIILKKNGPRASTVPILGLFSIIFKRVYWYIQQISGERLQDHGTSGITDRFKAILLLWFYCFMYYSRMFVLFEPSVCFHIFS